MTTRSRRKPKKLRSQNQQALILICLGAGIGLACLFLATRPYEQKAVAVSEPVKIATDVDMVLIPTPSRAIAKGERLGAVDFSRISWPKNRLMGEYVDDVGKYKDAVALTPLPKYLPVPISAVSRETLDNNEVVEGIPDGMRAITVKVDAESAVEGWARSGNFVDVMVVRASSDNTVGLETKVIAENVRILSAGQSTTPFNSGGAAPAAPATVTLLVSQEDALKIKTATNIGKITFALRGKGDDSAATSVAMNQKKLLGGGERAPQAVQPDYKGFARDAEGKVYVLADKRRWIRSEGSAGVFKPVGETGAEAKSQPVNSGVGAAVATAPATLAATSVAASAEIKTADARSGERASVTIHEGQ